MEKYIDEELDAKCKTLAEYAKKYSVELRRMRYDYGFSYDDGDWKQPKVSNLNIVGTYDYSNRNSETFRQEAVKLFECPECPKESIKIGLNPNIKGIKVPMLEQVIPTIGEKSYKKTLKCRQGEYTLIYIWNTKSPRCMDYMKVNDDILNKHPEWLGKLRLVEISIDDSLDLATKHIRGKAWERIDHYWVNRHNVVNTFWKEVLDKEEPYYILTDYDAYVVSAGDPDWISLEKNIEKWMDGEMIDETYSCEDDKKRFGEKPVKNEDFSLRKCYTTTEDIMNDNQNQFALFDYIVFDINLYKEIPMNGPTRQFGEIKIRYSYYENRREVNTRIINSIKEAFKDCLTVTEFGSVREMGSVEYGNFCDKCKKKLGKCDQYMCVACSPSIYYCLDCLKPRDNIKSENDMVHEHAFYYIQKDSEPVMKELKVIRVKVTDLREYDMKHVITCRTCKKQKETNIQWKCANCGHYDFCNDCFKIFKNPDDPEHEKLKEIAASIRHDIKTHVYVRDDVIGQLGYYY